MGWRKSFVFTFLPMVAAIIPAIKSFGKPSTSPATAPAANDILDDRLTFLLAQLAADEQSLKTVNAALVRAGYHVAVAQSRMNAAEKGNELMDRNAGGPISYKDFYGRTARDYVMHDRGSPVYHQVRRPPQFDYIYRANSDQASRARDEIAALGKQTDALLARRRQLELEESSLWLTIAFQPIADREIQYRPLYRFRIAASQDNAASAARIELLRSAILFLRIADKSMNAAIDSVSKSQEETVNNLAERLNAAESGLEDSMSQAKLSADLIPSDLQSSDTILLLGRRMNAQCKNVKDAYRLAQDSGTTGDDARKPMSRGQLQGSLLTLSNAASQLDEEISKIAADWKIKEEARVPSPDNDKMPSFAAKKEAGANSENRESDARVAPSGDSGWVDLFNGSDTNGWTVRKGRGDGKWSVENGLLIGTGFGCELVTQRNDYANVCIRVEVMINKGGNSGILARMQPGVRPNVGRFEAQIECDGIDPNKTGSIYMIGPRGRPGCIAPVRYSPVLSGQWFTMEFECNGGNLKVSVNGIEVAHAERVAFPSGAIGIGTQHPGTVVKFRKIQLKEIKQGS